jgi:hypothetical protein
MAGYSIPGLEERQVDKVFFSFDAAAAYAMSEAKLAVDAVSVPSVRSAA